MPPRRLAVALGVALLAAACLSPRLDAPAKRREPQLPLHPWTAPLATYSASPDGTSWSWSALLGLVGAEAEGERRAQKLLPLFWHDVDPPYVEQTFVFPFYYGRTQPESRVRWYSLLWGVYESPEERHDHVLASLLRWKRSKQGDAWSSGVFPVYSWKQVDGVHDLTLVPILGLAHLARVEWGFPGEGVTTGARGREGARRVELVDLLGFLSLAGYDDVGDRREFRLLSVFDSEVLSLVRSWRARDPADPFVREWVFPLYMNVRGRAGGWSYVGPLWGHGHDAEAGTRTDWWLLGLLARGRTPERETWRVLGLPVWSAARELSAPAHAPAPQPAPDGSPANR